MKSETKVSMVVAVQLRSIANSQTNTCSVPWNLWRAGQNLSAAGRLQYDDGECTSHQTDNGNARLC